MKSIKFSDNELDFIHQQYQIELEEAETYVENLKNILKKIGSTPKGIETIEITEKKRRGRKPKIQIEPTVKVIKKRGPKPKIQKEEAIITVEKKDRKPRSDKGKKRLKTVKPVKEQTSELTDTRLEPIPNKPIIPKKKVKRRRKYKPRGVFLTPISKPIKLKEVEETPPQIETTPEKAE